MEALLAAAREAALHALQGAPFPNGVAPGAFVDAKEAFSRALAGAIGAGIEADLLTSAVVAARTAYSAAQNEAVAALAAQHNASDGPDGPRLLPLPLELQVAIVNKAYSDR